MGKAGLLISCILLLVGGGCRKGDEDPFLNLTTRKHRICGDWAMTSYFAQECGMQNGDTTNCGHRSGDMNQLTLIHDGDSTYYSEIITYHECSFKMNKDYTWVRIRDYDIDTYYDHPSQTFITHMWLREETHGSWAFVGKSEEYKNKERVMFHMGTRKIDYGEKITTIDDKSTPGIDDIDTNNYPDGEVIYAPGQEYLTYDLLMLCPKKMKWVLIGGYTQDGDGTVSKEEISWEKIK